MAGLFYIDKINLGYVRNIKHKGVFCGQKISLLFIMPKAKLNIRSKMLSINTHVVLCDSVLKCGINVGL